MRGKAASTNVTRQAKRGLDAKLSASTAWFLIHNLPLKLIFAIPRLTLYLSNLLERLCEGTRCES